MPRCLSLASAARCKRAVALRGKIVFSPKVGPQLNHRSAARCSLLACTARNISARTAVSIVEAHGGAEDPAAPGAQGYVEPPSFISISSSSGDEDEGRDDAMDATAQ